MEFAKKANELVSPECKEFFSEQSDQDIQADIESWEEFCKDANAGDANQDADDADDADGADGDAQQAVDNAAQNVEDASNTVADGAQKIIDDAKDAIAKATGGAFTVSTIFSALAAFAALY